MELKVRKLKKKFGKARNLKFVREFDDTEIRERLGKIDLKNLIFTIPKFLLGIRKIGQEKAGK
jgi:hypothetical protein